MDYIPANEFYEEDFDFEVDEYAEHDYPGFDDEEDFDWQEPKHSGFDCDDEMYYNTLCASKDKHTLITVAVEMLHLDLFGLCAQCVVDKAKETLSSFGIDPEKVNKKIDDRLFNSYVTVPVRFIDRMKMRVETDDLPF